MFKKEIDFGKSRFTVVAATAMLALFGASHQALADSGFYLGGSVGDATLAVDIPDGDLGDVFEFDESDFAWKAFGGYNFDLGLIDLGIEAGYVDLGNPKATLLDQEIDLSVTGWDAFGVAGVGLGPINVFVKAGLISWDAKVALNGIAEEGDDGSDPAYGIGLSFAIGPIDIRAEYEAFDLDDVEDLYMLSAGLVYRF